MPDCLQLALGRHRSWLWENPIAGFLFVLSIEILSLLNKKPNVQPYSIKDGSTIPYHPYADYLTVYLKYKRYNQNFNTSNVECLKTLEKWSGLQVYSGKNQVVDIGMERDELPLVKKLKLKWCIEFKLLGINFDRMLDKMDHKGLMKIVT